MLHVFVIRDGKQVDLQGAQRGFVQPSRWRRSWDFAVQDHEKQLKASLCSCQPPSKIFFPFGVMLVCVHLSMKFQLHVKRVGSLENSPAKEVMEDGEWSCPSDQSDGRRHPLCSLSMSMSFNFFVFSLLLSCYSTHGVSWLDLTTGNISTE